MLLLRSRWIAVVLCLGVAPASARENFAAPEIVIFYDERSSVRVSVAGWEQNHQWLLQAVPLRPDQRPLYSELAQRSSIKLAAFWGTQWRAYTRPDSIRVLAPQRANQHGTFYPAVGTRPALVDIGALRVLTDSGVALLRVHGVPVRVENQ